MRVDQSIQIAYQSVLGSKSSTDAGWSFQPSDDDNEMMTGNDASRLPISGSSIDTTSISAGYWYRSDTTETTSTDKGGSATSTFDTPVISAVEAPDSGDQSLLDEFEKWSKMTPAERIRAQYLDAHDLTEEQFHALPPEQQAQINKEIADEIKRQLGGSDDNAALTM